MDIASIGAAAIPVFGGSIAAMVQSIENHHIQSDIRMLSDIVNSLYERIDVIDSAPGTQDLFVDLAAHAIRVAPELRSDELRMGVANIVTLAFCVMPPQVERAHLLIDIAARLSPDHLAVLRLFSKVLVDSNEQSDRNMAKPWPRAWVAESLPHLDFLIDPLIAQLESYGTIREMRLRNGGSEILNSSETGWTLSAFGVQLLDHLDGEVGQKLAE